MAARELGLSVDQFMKLTSASRCDRRRETGLSGSFDKGDREHDPPIAAPTVPSRSSKVRHYYSDFEAASSRV